MPSTPGHHQYVELIGDVMIILKGGVLMRVYTGEPIDIAVLTNPLPEGLTVGSRLWVRGELRQEKEVIHRRNLHFIEPEHLALVHRYKTAS